MARIIGPINIINNKVNTQPTVIAKYGNEQENIDHLSESKKLITKFSGDVNFIPTGPGESALPKSLFYENTEGPNGAPNGLYNHYLIGSTSNTNGEPFTYKGSELYQNNSVVSTEESRNPTAHNIVKATTISGAYLDPSSDYVGQPYNPKDFLFCKYYGSIPNNRMITLRRFPTPVFDNLKVPVASSMPGLDKDGKTIIEKSTSGMDKITLAKTAPNVPVAQAITYFGEGTGNELNNLIGFFTGTRWNEKTQREQTDENNNDPGFYDGFSSILQGVFGPRTNELIQGASTIGGTFFEQENFNKRWSRTIFDTLRAPGNPLSERIFVDINTVDKMFVRGRGLVGGIENEMKVVFKYDLTSASDINSKMLFLDLLTNLLSIGTDYGKFLTPQILENPRTIGMGFPGGSDGYLKFKLDPVNWIGDLIKKNHKPEVAAKTKAMQDQLAEFEAFRNNGVIDKGSNLYRSLTTLLTENMLSNLYFEPMMLSGYPTGDWHMVVGNPLNPIAMIGNLICKGVDIKFNSELGPDDFPTEMTATYTLQNARQRHRGEFESMFNRGQGRLYVGELSETTQAENVFISARTGKDLNQTSNTGNLMNEVSITASRSGGSAPKK